MEMTAIVRNADGIHLRPSNLILELVQDYPGEIRLESPNGQTDLRSILGLMMLAIRQGTAVKISVCGPDEDALCCKLADLFETEFDFSRQEQTLGSRR